MTTAKLAVELSDRNALVAGLHLVQCFLDRKNGIVVKEHDHSLDASRYAVLSGTDVQRTKVETQNADKWLPGYGAASEWLG